ncbi:MAG: amidase family protein [Pseudomonadales bacterium]|nr:amidase family protein [Pseudomonadales bacterium]
MNLSCCKIILPLILLLSMPVHRASAQWQRYDETADLAELAGHENPRMHFQLLNSKLLDKNDLWQAFAAELSQFTASDYEALKPLILDQSIGSLQLAVAAGRLSYEVIVTFYIYRIREIESDDERYINAVIALNAAAITRARMLDELRSGGTNVDADSIFGMPVLLKDNIGFDGLPTTAGAVALRENMTGNAFITDRLEEQGAIILGKANLSEWAYFFCNDCPSGYSALGGQTLNPYGRFTFGTGGSSSGSAAATAANYAVVAVGSETSGSILSPASANSLVGLKPTTGNLSRTGIVPISATLDTAGPIARSVADVVVMFNAMAGYDQNDMAMPLISDDFSLEYRVIDMQGRRLGIVEALADNSHYMAAVHLLADSGATTIELEFSPDRDDRFSQLLGGEMVRDLALYLDRFASSAVEITSISELRAFNEGNTDLRAPYGQGLVDMMAELDLSAAELELIRQELQSAARAQLDQLFDESKLDVLLSVNNRHAGIAALANYPALTIPMGYAEDGRPIGLTLFAPPFREQDLIDIGAMYEQLSKARKPPPLPYQ